MTKSQKAAGHASIDIGGASLPIDAYAVAATGILGIKGSGKSYAAGYLAEHLLDAGIPWIAFDPIGIWHYIRSPGEGAHAKGYPVVVAGGEHGDLPLEPSAVAEIVRAAMRNNLPLVLDLYSMALSKADWRRIVLASLEVLLYENKKFGRRHIFIEEAAEFVPQHVRGESAQVFGAMEKLIRMGGNVQLGVTLINPRAEDVNKSALELCDNVFLFRQKGKNSMSNLRKWVDSSGTGMGKSVTENVMRLGAGEAFFWGRGEPDPVRVRIPQKRSFHPDRTAAPAVHSKAQARAVDVGTFVARLKPDLDKLVREAEEARGLPKDAAGLRRALVEANKRLAENAGQPASVAAQADPAGSFEAGRAAGYGEGLLAGQATEFRRMQSEIDAFLDGTALPVDQIKSAVGEIGLRIEALRSATRIGPAAEPAMPVRPVPPPAVPVPKLPPAMAAAPADATAIGGVERRVLSAVGELQALQGGEAADIVLVGMCAGYANLRSKGFANARGALRTAGYVLVEDGRISLTDAGRRLIPPVQAPTRADLVARVRATVGGRGAEILDRLIAAHPAGVPRDRLAMDLGFENVRSKGFANPIGRLRTLGLIETADGAERAAPRLFGR